MGNIVFSLLHYESLTDTAECIDSLIKYLHNPRVHIVVVDNGSQTGKLSTISSNYDQYQNIHFLYSEKNLGFAKGNNIGFLYAKKTLSADIIILANNDLIFLQENFVEEMVDLAHITKFDIAGPTIVSMVDGKKQNPVPVQYQTISAVNKRILKNTILLFLSFLNLDKTAQKLIAKPVVEYFPTEDMDYQLHGACLLFANQYIEKYDGLYDGTFMYGEEDILKYLSQRNGMKMLYLKDLTVYHKEGSSTESIYGKGREKRQFYYRWSLDSCRKLRDMMKGS